MIVRGSQNVTAVQMHLPGSRVDPLDRASHKDLGAEPARLLQCPTRQLVAGDTRREAKVVLDSRRRAGLPPRRLSLDRDRPQALRRAVDGRGQARRSCTDNHRVVLGRPCLRAKAEQLGQPAKAGPLDGRAVDDANDENILRRRNGCAPPVASIRRVWIYPVEADLVAIEEAPHLPAVRVPAVPEHNRPGWWGLRGQTLEAAGPADALPRELADLLRDVRMNCRDRVVIVGLDPHNARLLGSPEPDREDGAEDYRDLTEDVSRVPLPDDALDPVDELHRLDPALQDCEERPVVTLVRCVLARREGDVGGNTREAVAGVHLEGGKNGNRSNLLSRDHAHHLLWCCRSPCLSILPGCRVPGEPTVLLHQ